jgi:hypothetical protein
LLERELSFETFFALVEYRHESCSGAVERC